MKAFPTAADNGHSDNQDGMDLRDYFAAKAMQAMLTESIHGVEGVAKWSYEVADAMMKARQND